MDGEATTLLLLLRCRHWVPVQLAMRIAVQALAAVLALLP
jgi:hypothetical protein